MAPNFIVSLWCVVTEGRRLLLEVLRRATVESDYDVQKKSSRRQLSDNLS
jgi:hypothetical protein